MSDHQRYQDELQDLLKELRNDCKAETSPARVAEEAPSTPVPDAAASGGSSDLRPDDAKRHFPPQEALSLSDLLDVARDTLAMPMGKIKPDSRALALDCLRLGVQIFFSEAESCRVGARDVLSVGAMGSLDERWSVRVAAAQLAGEILKRVGQEELSTLLSSEQGYWLSALLVDGCPEVKEAARVAFCSATSIPLDHTVRNASPTSAISSSSDLSMMAAASALVRGASNFLRATVAAIQGKREGGGGNSRAVDIATEARTRMAFRVLQGGVGLIESSGSRVGAESLGKIKRTLVEAIEVIEAWVLYTLNNIPPTLLPWEEWSSTTVDHNGVLGGSLSSEVRDTARALLGGGRCNMKSTATEAAIIAVEDFRAKCYRLSSGGGAGRAAESSEEDGKEEESWRRVYCAMLVRLETFFIPVERVDSKEKMQAADVVTEVRKKHKGRGKTLSSERASPAEETRGVRHDGSTEHRDALAGATCEMIDPVGDISSGVEPGSAESIARALEGVPSAFEHTVPFHLEDDNILSAVAKKAIRLRGASRRRWLIANAHLLLRAGKRLCDRCQTSPPNTTEARSPTETPVGQARIVKLLVATLPFKQASTDADNPIEAFLACTRRESDHQSSVLPQPSLANPEATATVTTHGAEIVTPVPWKACVVMQEALYKHQLLAPWAADPLTMKLATALVESAWSVLSRGDEHSLTDRSAEGIVLELRAVARSRGWREEDGVGVKHAVAATIRRLRFPLVAGSVLGHALPLALPLVDDHDASHQAVGLSLLLHIVAEATPTELSWHAPLLLEVLEQGLRGGGSRDPAAAMLRLTVAVRLSRHNSTSKGSAASVGREGFRIAREALAQAGRTNDGEVRIAMVCGAAALLELPGNGGGYAPCELLRPALLCLLPILQSSPISARLDARAATLRALNVLCRSCWPRVHAHASKLLCALLWTCGDCSRRAAFELDTTDGGRKDGKTTATFLRSRDVDIKAADDVVRSHAERLGALVVLLGGSAARVTLNEICAAVGALQPAAAAMLDLADAAQGEGRSAVGKGGDGSGVDDCDYLDDAGKGVRQDGLEAPPSAPVSTVSTS